MWRNCAFLLVAAGAVSLVGCGGSGAPGDAEKSPEPRQSIRVGNTIDPTTVANTGTPAAAVAVFLEAVRSGNDEVAAAMLSTVARARTAEMNMSIAPPGSDTAQYTIGRVRDVDQGMAHVVSTWSDLDDKAQRQSDDIVWVVKKEPKGWRISGVAEPLVLDFENPRQIAKSDAPAAEEGVSPADREESQAARVENSSAEIRR